MKISTKTVNTLPDSITQILPEQFLLRFPTETVAIEYIKNIYHPNGILNLLYCKKCERETKHYPNNRRLRSFSCGKCRYHISPLAKTPFRKSVFPIQSWLYALYMLSVLGPRMYAREYMRIFNVTYKTAWRMKKQLLPLLSDPRYHGLIAEFKEIGIKNGEQITREKQKLEHSINGRIGSEKYWKYWYQGKPVPK